MGRLLASAEPIKAAECLAVTRLRAHLPGSRAICRDLHVSSDGARIHGIEHSAVLVLRRKRGGVAGDFLCVADLCRVARAARSEPGA